MIPSTTRLTVAFMPPQIVSQLSLRNSSPLISAPPGRSQPNGPSITPAMNFTTGSKADLMPLQTLSHVILSAAVILSQFLIARTIPAIARATPIIIRPIGPIAIFNAAIAVVWSQVAAVAIVWDAAIAEMPVAIAGSMITIGPRLVARFPIGASAAFVRFFMMSNLSDIVRVAAPSSATLPSESPIAASMSSRLNTPLSMASLNRTPAPAPKLSVAIAIASVSVSAFWMLAIISCNPADMSVTPSDASFWTAVFRPGIILEADSPAASMLPTSAVASSKLRPIVCNCGPNLTTVAASVLIGTPTA